MDGSNHGYLQEDATYDDLMNNAGWPSSGDQFAYPQAHQAQDLYSRFPTNQTSFDQYDLSQQPSYAPQSFSNSPYTSQYQHARPSDVFGPTSYNVDPSLQPYHASESTFSFAPQGNHTISPHSLQYSNSSHQPPNHSASNAMFQHSANNYSQIPQEQQPLYSNAQNGSIPNHLQAVSNDPPGNDLQQDHPGKFDIIIPASAPRPQPVNTQQVQDSLRITHPALQASNNSSRPRLEYAPYVAWDDTPVQVAPGLKNTIPKYHPRKSKSGRDLIPGFDVSRISTPARSAIKKIRVPKEKKSSISKYKGTSQGPKQASRLANLRDGASLGSSVKSPTPTESSSSEEGSSSEEESEYEEDATMPVQDISEVRDAERPTDVSGAARWDAIGIIWKDPHSTPDNDIVKGAIEEYANVVSAFRVQLKANATQSQEAASRPAEVARLTAERTVLLDQLYQTIKAALDLGYPSIVENLGNHQKLLVGLTTTLMDCIKAGDYIGNLPRAIFKLLAKFQTLSDEMLKKLKFDGIQRKWAKKADEDIKKDIAMIVASTTESKEKSAKAQKEVVKAEEKKKMLEKVEQSKTRTAETLKAATNFSKRPHEGDSNIAKPNKKFASDVAGAPSSSPKSIPPKRPTNLLANNLLGITAKPVAKAPPKKREPSPPSGSSFSVIGLLADIEKPPEPPKAPEAPAHPAETAEEKKRRERKESRRHLRVKFKEGPELEQIRLFKHEQAEDEGRQDDMLRDAHDDRSEGMMHKKRVAENIDASLEDDDGPSDDIEDGPYPSLVNLNLRDVDKSTGFGPTYITRGGEKTFTTAEQQTQDRREASELMVVYTNLDDIPPSPKEPAPEAEEPHQEREVKGPVEPWLVQRLQQIQQYGPEYSSQILASQNQARKFQQIHEFDPHGQAQSTNVNMVHGRLGGPAPPPPPPQIPLQKSIQVTPTPTMDPQSLKNLIDLVASLKGKPYPPIEPPDWMTNEAQRAIWWDGYIRDKATKERQVTDAQLAQAQAAQYQAPPPLAAPQQTSAPPMQLFPPQMTQATVAISAPVQPYPQKAAQPGMPQVDINQQMQAYLASITNAQNGNGSSNQQYDFSSWSDGVGRSQEQHTDDQYTRRDGDWDNEGKRSRSKQNQDSHNSNSKQRGYEMKQWNGFGNDGPLDAKGEYKGKKKPCKFWQQGKCAKGAKCTFLHDGE